ncbi:MAG TPA: hypothetical protein VLI68_02910 [Hanamia sp.]|jgi:hypothetical protein|nr:hypothetical protein [Hanamia sp.]
MKTTNDHLKKINPYTFEKFFIMKELLTKLFLFIIFASLFFSCENHRFDSDKRQIAAKNEIRNKLEYPRAFDVTGFKEDTVESQNESDFKKQIRYSLDVEYFDSNKVLQKKKGIVMFSPDGQSIITSKITNR